MKYYSTNKKAPEATLEKAVVKGLAEDRGLYMPEIIKALPESFFANIERMSFQEIAYTVADAFFGEDVDAESTMKKITPNHVSGMPMDAGIRSIILLMPGYSSFPQNTARIPQKKQ